MGVLKSKMPAWAIYARDGTLVAALRAPDRYQAWRILRQTGLRGAQVRVFDLRKKKKR